jgi:intracellular sulfur oxidation DsrE/DsrF family protein
MKILSIVESAYRGTLEEQDDTVLWLNHALKNNGADVSLLLRGNAVNYIVRGHDASGLIIGDRPLAHPPQLDKDVTKLMAVGVGVYVVEEDVGERGLQPSDTIDGYELVPRSRLPALLDRFDRVWHW